MAFAPTEQLESLLSFNPSATSAEARALLNRLSVETKKRADQGAASSFDFFSSASVVLGKIKGASFAPVRMSCLWSCGTFFQVCGYFDRTLLVAQQLERLAIRTDDKVWLRKSFILSGMAEAEVGDVGGALLHYEKALVLARDEGPIAQIASLVNIGTALNYCSLHREAIPCFQRADHLIRSEPDIPQAATLSAVTLGNMAQSFLYLEEFHRGFEIIRLAVADAIEPSDVRGALSRATREWTYVQLALELGRLDEARIHAGECRKYGQWGDNPRGLNLADIAQGLCDVFGGDVHRGLHTLESTLSRANDECQREDALRALVKAHDELGHDGPALRYLMQLRCQLQLRGKRGILALFSPNSAWTEWSRESDSAQNLQPLECREAKLRARIAEKEAAASRIEMLERFAVTADLREETSGEHGYRVGKLSSLVAEKLGLEEDACKVLEVAARLHDIGKIGIPDRILLTSEKLREAERQLMAAHTTIGAELLANSQMPHLRIAEQIARYHHEWWDGTGYPAKLRGKRIPLHARIVAIADVFDALTHGRSYAPAWTIDEALEEIISRRERQFDPELTDRFIELMTALRSLHPTLDDYLGKGGRSSPFAQARQRIRAMLVEGNRIRGESVFDANKFH